MPYIYKITNEENDLIYIGQTIASILTRFKEHCYDAKKGSKNKFHSAMREIGIDKFHVELVEECSLEKLDDRERYWINFYDSYKNGYNSKNGGQNSLLNTDYKNCIQYYLENKDKKTLTQITSELGVGFNRFRDILEEENIRKKQKHGKFNDWEEEEKKSIIKDAKNGKSLRELISKYHHDGETIKQLLKKENIFFSGERKKPIPILQLDIETNEIIAEWKSIYAAQKAYNNRHIGECISGKRKTASGYKWKIKD